MPEIDTDINISPENSDDNLDIQYSLKNDILPEIDKSTEDKMLLAFYTGNHTVYAKDSMSGPSYTSYEFPVTFVDYLKEDERTSGTIDPQNPNLSLRLDDPNGLKPLYEQSKPIDTTREYTFRFIYPGKMDSKNIFVFKNKEFVCKEFRRIIDYKGTQNIIEGVFYAYD
jgi:hypothetical protein